VQTFIKVREASKRFCIGINLLYKAIHEKELKAYKPNGRDFLLKTSEIEAWIESKEF
jgi:excisionase family DNA binding protein